MYIYIHTCTHTYRQYVFSLFNIDIAVMASTKVRKLCGAHFHCDLNQQKAVVQTRNNIASRKRGSFWSWLRIRSVL